jgi:hypothetical protein
VVKKAANTDEEKSRLRIRQLEGRVAVVGLSRCAGRRT